MAKQQSETELSDVGETKGNVDAADGTAPAAGSRIKAFFNFFTVEPFMLCFIISSVISGMAVNQLNTEKACRSDLNYTEYICSQYVSGTLGDNSSVNAIQILVADLNSWTQPLASGLPAIVILFIGQWSDTTGNRKYLMLIPALGELISAIGLILAIYFFLEWPLWVTRLIETLPSALSGGASVIIMGCYSYIADITTVESRTFRMGCFTMTATVGQPLANAVGGVLTRSLGYYGVFGISAALHAIACVYVCLRIHDVRNTPIEGTVIQKLVAFFNPANAWDTLSLLFLSPKRELIHIWLIVLVHIIVLGPSLGVGSVLYNYSQKYLGMDLVYFSLFTTYSTIMGIIGTSIAVALFSKRLQVHDALIGVIATTSRVVSNFVYGLAPNRAWFFAGPLFDLFGNDSVIVVRSLATKVVAAEKVGKMCSLIGLVEAISVVINTPLYNKLYAHTLDTFIGTVFFVGGALTVPAIFVYLIIYALHRRAQRDVVKDPDAKEMYAHENVNTVL